MRTPQPQFDASAELAAVQAARQVARRRITWGRSRLLPHRAELVQLRQAGASFADLAMWLRKQKRIKVDRSTVRRYLVQLPELAQEDGNA